MISNLQALLNFYYMFLHVSDGKSFPPPLSAKEEAKYFEDMKKGNEKAREKLIEHNLRLVAHIVKKYYTASDEQDDLISIGTVGLIKAIDSFDPSNGARFATYGAKCLQNEILMYFRAKKKTAAEVSINEAIDSDKDGNPLTYMDVISAPDTICEDIYYKTCAKRAIKFINECLDARERRIIRMRYGLDGENAMTQKQIAKRLGISRSYVSRIEKSAILKLEEYLK